MATLNHYAINAFLALNVSKALGFVTAKQPNAQI
jgi:hypothetical protein